MIESTGLEAVCHVGANANAFASIITQLHQQPFTAEKIMLRKKVLGDTYNTRKNAEYLIQYLW